MTTATRAPALRFSGVTKEFSGGTTALADTNLEVAAGEFVSVRCPACDAAEALVATRERLGCRACTAGTSARSPAAPAVRQARS